MCNVFRSDKILDTILKKLRECAQSKGYGVAMVENFRVLQLPLYSTKLLVFLEVMPNALHLDSNDASIQRVLSSPDHYIDQALHYFTEVRSIPEPETCWIYIEFVARSVSIYLTIRNTNVEERISEDGVVSYINLLDNQH